MNFEPLNFEPPLGLELCTGVSLERLELSAGPERSRRKALELLERQPGYDRVIQMLARSSQTLNR